MLKITQVILNDAGHRTRNVLESTWQMNGHGYQVEDILACVNKGHRLVMLLTHGRHLHQRRIDDRLAAYILRHPQDDHQGEEAKKE